MKVLAVAGIARPERFFDALRGLGFDVVRERAFPDHRWFTPADLEAIDREAARTHAGLVVTTEKDAVRIGARSGWAALPMEVVIKPEAAFADWLITRVTDCPPVGPVREY